MRKSPHLSFDSFKTLVLIDFTKEISSINLFSRDKSLNLAKCSMLAYISHRFSESIDDLSFLKFFLNLQSCPSVFESSFWAETSRFSSLYFWSWVRKNFFLFLRHFISLPFIFRRWYPKENGIFTFLLFDDCKELKESERDFLCAKINDTDVKYPRF